MQDILADMIVLEVVHHMHSISLHLLVGSNRAKNDLSKALRGKCAETNTADGTSVLDQRERPVLPKTKSYNTCFSRFPLVVTDQIGAD